MKKKVIALIMIIPLIFLITIFSVGQVASILTEIPVSGIKITTQHVDGFINIDMAKYVNNPDSYYYMTAQVEPANANNTGYHFEVEPIDDETELANIDIDEETGLLSLYGTGKARITAVSNDGGYKDSIILTVTSSKVISITPSLLDKNGQTVEMAKVGDYEYNVELTPGNYQFAQKIYPDSQKTSSVAWTSSNENILKINQVTGKAQTKLSGTAVLTLDCENSIEGLFHPITINVTVPYLGGESGMTIEGFSSNELLFSKGSETVSFLIEFEESRFGLGEDFFLNFEGDVAYIQNGQPTYKALDNEGKHYLVTLTLDPGYPENLEFSFSIGDNEAKTDLKVTFRDFSFNVYTSSHLTNAEVIYQKKGDPIDFTAEGNPSDDDVIYDWYSSSNGLEINPRNDGKFATIKATAVGEYDLTISAFKKVVNGDSVEKGAFITDVVKTISVIRGISSIEFVDNAINYGIENLLTVGNVSRESAYNYNYNYELKYKVKYEDSDEFVTYSEDVDFRTEDRAIAQPDSLGESMRINIIGDGITKMTATWKNGVYFDQNVTASIKFRAVKGGVVIGANPDVDNRQNYEALKTAAEDGKKIILMKDVNLGWENMSEAELISKSYTMYTDYDWTFYKLVTGERPRLRYLIEFKNDVYGNGFTINAENFTTAKDSIGNPKLFKGPLEFLDTGTYGAVKAQDNICFLVREKGVTINNVGLIGCSDRMLTSDVDSNNPNGATGAIDMSKLNNVGTVLEISGNTRLLNSRISNGRTAVRIFGGETTNGDPIVDNYSDVNVAEERLVAHIESCEIKQAREFLIKIGSNRAVRVAIDPSNPNGIVPKVPTKVDGTPYILFDENNKKDQYFYDNYVITDVSLKNTILAKSGLFAIAMETHFNGKYLANSHYAQGMASNSFPSVLRMEGDVRIYDWKKLDSIDSTTLIEIQQGQDTTFQINLAGMVEKVAELKVDGSDELKYPGIIALNDKGEKCVHAGVCFYGGGENYSYLDTTQAPLPAQMSNYRMNLSILEGEDGASMAFRILKNAAGNANFSFYMYNSNSEFDYEKQQTELNSGKAYIIPVAPVEGN